MREGALSSLSIGPYTLLEQIGSGGMGVVFKAYDPANSRTVAIKMIGGHENIHQTLVSAANQPLPIQFNARRRMMLIREARIAGTLRHDGIVRVYDYGLHRGLLYIVMELLEGRSLHSYTNPADSTPFSQKLDFMGQVCAALEFAHSQGISHRDVKPANIFVLPDGTTKLLDFGLAHANGPNGQQNLIAGTLAYMAPELLRGRPIDPRQADLWAAAVTLFQLIAARPAPPALPIEPVEFRIRTHAPSPVAKEAPFAPELNAIHSKAFHPELTQRYLTAAEFASDLRELQGQVRADRFAPDNGPRCSEASPGPGKLTRPAFDLTIGITHTGNKVQVRRVIENPLIPQIASEVPAAIVGLAFLGLGAIAVVAIIFTFADSHQTAFSILMLLVVSSVSQNMFFWSSPNPPPPSSAPKSASPHSSQRLGRFESSHRCQKCNSWMQPRSRWTRYAQTEATYDLCMADCIAALNEDLWEDAARLLSLYDQQNPVAAGYKATPPPIRYKLDFFHCSTCASQAARITIQDRKSTVWVTRKTRSEAFKEGPAREVVPSPEVRTVRTRVQLAAAEIGDSVEAYRLTTPLTVIAALAVFFFVSWLIVLALNHSGPRRPPTYLGSPRIPIPVHVQAQ